MPQHEDAKIQREYNSLLDSASVTGYQESLSEEMFCRIKDCKNDFLKMHKIRKSEIKQHSKYATPYYDLRVVHIVRRKMMSPERRVDNSFIEEIAGTISVAFEIVQHVS